jgi:hypothetical protein
MKQKDPRKISGNLDALDALSSDCEKRIPIDIERKRILQGSQTQIYQRAIFLRQNAPRAACLRPLEIKNRRYCKVMILK